MGIVSEILSCAKTSHRIWSQSATVLVVWVGWFGFGVFLLDIYN